MKTTLITTVLNEEDSILQFLESIKNQSRKPDEIVIVDGGSKDATVSKISAFQFPITKVKIIKKNGNRSVGRNAAIQASSNEIIAVADAGCILEKHWLEKIVKPFEKRDVDVVSGYYKGKAETVFQKCVIPYALVMPDKLGKPSLRFSASPAILKVKPSVFLPATRSMAFKKSVWKKVGGFNEKLSHNEDYAFAKSLQKMNAHIVFEKSAVVSWTPRSNLISFYTMIRRFAYGDAEAGIYRPKVILIFLRYVIGLSLLGYVVLGKQYVLLQLLYILVLGYLVWVVWKNYKYVKSSIAFFYLPLLQLTSDVAVIVGTTKGCIHSLKKV